MSEEVDPFLRALYERGIKLRCAGCQRVLEELPADGILRDGWSTWRSKSGFKIIYCPDCHPGRNGHGEVE